MKKRLRLPLHSNKQTRICQICCTFIYHTGKAFVHCNSRGKGSQPTNNRAKSNSALPKIFFWWWGTGERGDAAVFRQKIEEEDRILNPHQKSESSGGTIDTISDFARYSVSPTHYRTNASHDAPASSSEAAAPISLSLPFAVECEMRIFYVMKGACALCARCKADDFCWRVEW